MAGMMGPWQGYDGYGMMGYGGWGYPFFGWGMILLWIIVFGLLAYLVYTDAGKHGMNGVLWGILVFIPMAGILFLLIYLVIRETRGQTVSSGGKSAEDILRERYARGEISSDQFRQMGEDLKR